MIDEDLMSLEIVKALFTWVEVLDMIVHRWNMMINKG